MAKMIVETPVEIRPVQSKAEIDEARALFREYAASLGVDLCFQHFEEELAALPGDYAPPQGCLLLAWGEGQVCGCGALRPHGEGTAEMKRMYVRPPFRGRGVGRLIAERLLAVARQQGYREVCLDTLTSMQAARGLYASLGFAETEPYYHNPLPGACYMKLKLEEGPGRAKTA